MTMIALPFAPPDYDLSDNGTRFWPPECYFSTEPWASDWPFVFEAWERYAWTEDRRKIMEFRNLVECNHKEWIRDPVEARRLETSYRRCAFRGQVGEWARHARIEHIKERGPHGARSELPSANFVNKRWIYEMMGFPELWDGRPQGWYLVVDARRPERHDYETDFLELGRWPAEALLWGND